MPTVVLDNLRSTGIKLACFHEEIQTLGVRDTAVRYYTLHLSFFLPNEKRETHRSEERERQDYIDDDGLEDELGANDLAKILLEQKSEKLHLRRLFDVRTEAAVSDKTWMNDEASTRPKVVGKCNDPYAMRTNDSCLLVHDVQRYSALLS
jgi:hypothetical protein